MHDLQGWPNIVIAIVAVGLVLALRLRAIGRERRLRLETLWVAPALYLGVAVLLFRASPPDARGWAIALVALAIGAAIGWQRGAMMAIRVDPATHALSHRSSAATLLFLVALIALRFGLRAVAARTGGGWHLGAALVTEALVASALGMFAATRLEMFLRARRLLAAARAA